MVSQVGMVLSVDYTWAHGTDSTRASFMGTWPGQSHKAPCSEGPHAWFNVLQLLS